MVSFEEIKLYLPKYLSPESTSELLKNLKDFPESIESKFYSKKCQEEDIIYQGDGLNSCPVINLPDTDINRTPVLVISNTCDNNPENMRFFESKICYCPIFSLRKYKELLLKIGEQNQRVKNHIRTLRKQRITQIFYLPQGASLNDEHIVFFNNIVSCDSDILFRDAVNKNKMFCLSDFGLYLFVFKLSIYFTRLNEGKGRDS